ncbi:hypothetical protein [Brevibacterium litoralis]|uniref:hypothetical protein n=1 Tax=Brevibacterium litoralis TaxID=3138935 RepID=UPI0032EAED4A
MTGGPTGFTPGTPERGVGGFVPSGDFPPPSPAAGEAPATRQIPTRAFVPGGEDPASGTGQAGHPGNGYGPGGAPRRRGGKAAVLTTGAVALTALLVLGAFVAFTHYRVTALVAALEATAEDAEELFTALSEDPESADGHLADVQAGLRESREILHAFPLGQGTWVPGVGDDLEAADTVLQALEDVAEDTGPTVVAAAQLVDFGEYTSGTGDLFSYFGEDLVSAYTTLQDLPEALETLEESRDTVADIDTVGLRPAVAEAVEEVATGLDEAYTQVETPAQGLIAASEFLPGI